ncbi:MAG: hypothetical protein ACRDIC_05990 [bacterium]
MARCSVTFPAVNPNSTTFPACGLYAIAGQDLKIREVGVFNNGTTAVRFQLVKLTTAGTATASTNETNVDFGNHTVLGAGFHTFITTAPTLGAAVGYMPVGAAVGAGTILTFYGEANGLFIPAGTANGVGLVQLAAVSQAVDAYFIWDE